MQGKVCEIKGLKNIFSPVLCVPLMRMFTKSTCILNLLWEFRLFMFSLCPWRCGTKWIAYETNVKKQNLHKKLFQIIITFFISTISLILSACSRYSTISLLGVYFIFFILQSYYSVKVPKQGSNFILLSCIDTFNYKTLRTILNKINLSSDIQFLTVLFSAAAAAVEYLWPPYLYLVWVLLVLSS